MLRYWVLLGREARKMDSDVFPGDLEPFTEYGLQLGARLLQLMGQAPVRLM